MSGISVMPTSSSYHLLPDAQPDAGATSKGPTRTSAARARSARPRSRLRCSDDGPAIPGQPASGRKPPHTRRGNRASRCQLLVQRPWECDEGAPDGAGTVFLRGPSRPHDAPVGSLGREGKTTIARMVHWGRRAVGRREVWVAERAREPGTRTSRAAPRAAELSRPGGCTSSMKRCVLNLFPD